MKNRQIFKFFIFRHDIKRKDFNKYAGEVHIFKLRGWQKVRPLIKINE